MNLVSQNQLQPPRHDETVFRLALWGPLLAFLLFLLGVLSGVAIFFTCYQSSSIWGMILSGLYTLIMFGLCRVLFRAVRAAFSPSNWLARIGPHGVLLKFRSYLHNDFPEEDPIALQLSWPEILDAQLQREFHTTTDSDGKSRIARWFLALTLNPRYVDMDRITSALAFEFQRKPAHFLVDDLKHELFLARKNRAGAAEIARIKQEIAQEKKRFPGKHSKVRFNDRPIVFVEPDQVRIAWTHITPGKKKLRQLLSSCTKVISDQEQEIEIDKPMTESEFMTLLETLLGRNDKIEALKLVRHHRGLSTTEAKAYLESIAAPSLRHD